MKQIKETNNSSHWWFVMKQDKTDQKPWFVLVMKQGEMKWNNETDTIPSLSIFFKLISVS